MKKNYVGIVRDHTGSMQYANLVQAAAKDYNNLIHDILSGSSAADIDTIVSVVECGYDRVPRPRAVVTNSSIKALKPIQARDYHASAPGTPLLDSVGMLIDLFSKVPDFSDPQVAFLITVITDGGENASVDWTTKLKGEIQRLQMTDRWSFVFRIPRGNASYLHRFGIPDGNILEWETTEKGLVDTYQVTRSGMQSYYSGLTRGVTSTKSFFRADLSEVSRSEVRQSMEDISSEVEIFKVRDESEANTGIRELVEKRTKKPFRKGSAFYELTKYERAVQDYKQIIIRDKKSAKTYVGAGARQLLGLPTSGNISISPGDHGNFKIFIQSTSVNRKIPVGSSFMVWNQA